MIERHIQTLSESFSNVPPPACGGEGLKVGGNAVPTYHDRSDPRTKKARSLRKSMTLEERIVWSQLKQVDIIGHFRRQVPIGSYFVDFAHLGAKLIVEIDGSQHGSPIGLHKDQRRTNFLESCGFEVLRFWNYEVCKNRDDVIKTIFLKLVERQTPHPQSLPTINGWRDVRSLNIIELNGVKT